MFCVLQVSSQVPKIPRRNIDDLILTLEGAMKTPALTEGPSTRGTTPYTPQPPTSSRTSHSRVGSHAPTSSWQSSQSRHGSQAPTSPHPSPQPQSRPGSRPLPPITPTKEDQEKSATGKDNFGGDAFFMTQVSCASFKNKLRTL